MKLIDLFSGTGGFSIAARWTGWKTVAFCETDKFCRKVLQHHFPDAYHHGDIHTFNYETIDCELTKRYGSNWRNGGVTVSGGFPCQPFSVAGHRKGTADDRHLWPEMLRVVREFSPDYAVAENVCGLLGQQRGMVFEQVCADLEAVGYEVQPFVVPACAVDAPHRRDRVWIVAANTNRHDAAGRGHGKTGIAAGEIQGEWNVAGNGFAGDSGGEGVAADAAGIGQPRRKQTGAEREMEKQSGRFHCTHDKFDRFPTQSPVCTGNDGISFKLADISFPSWRRQGIKALGNAVVPQLAYQIFKAIEMIDNINFIQQRIK